MKIRRRRPAATVPSMAMGDIAFNLLVFFVILAKAQDDSHLQWEPAQGKNLQNAGQTRVSIVIDKDEKLYLNGQQVSVDQLEPSLTDLFGDALPGERAVVLKIHRETTAHRFEPVIEAVSKAGGELYHIVRDEGTP